MTNTNILENAKILLDALWIKFISPYSFLTNGLDINEIVVAIVLFTIILVLLVSGCLFIESEDFSIIFACVIFLFLSRYIPPLSNLVSPWPLWIKVAILSIVGLLFISLFVGALIMEKKKTRT